MRDKLLQALTAFDAWLTWPRLLVLAALCFYGVYKAIAPERPRIDDRLHRPAFTELVIKRSV